MALKKEKEKELHASLVDCPFYILPVSVFHTHDILDLNEINS